MEVRVVHNRKKALGLAPVQIECYFSRTRRIYFTTGVRVLDEHWDSQKQQVSKKHPRAIVLNLRIRQFLEKIYQWEQNQTLRGVALRPDDLKKVIGGGRSSWRTLNEYIRHQLDSGPETKTLRPSTLKRQRSICSTLDAFGKVYFDELDHHTLEKFQRFLLERMQPGTTAGVHRVLRKFVRRAKNDSLIEKNPYDRFRLPMENVRMVYLTAEEIDRIRQYRGTQRLEKVRDIFLFQCLTGMSFVDMQALQPSDIVKGGPGGAYIEKERLKTGASAIIPLFDEASALAEKYADTNHCFPRMSNQKLNAYLKEIADICGIEKTLTSHVARHTLGTLLVSKGLAMESVASILGHKTTRTTAKYAKILIGKIQADLKRLNIDKI